MIIYLFIFDNILLLNLLACNSLPSKGDLFLVSSPLDFSLSAVFPVFAVFEPFWFFLSEADNSLDSFSFLLAAVGTLGILTGSIGELVLERLPKNRIGFSGLTFVF